MGVPTRWIREGSEYSIRVNQSFLAAEREIFGHLEQT